MPLRDHFRSPLDDISSWEGFYGGWPMEIVRSLANTLPPDYVAAPHVHHGAFIEIDVAAFEKDEPNRSQPPPNGGGTAATNDLLATEGAAPAG